MFTEQQMRLQEIARAKTGIETLDEFCIIDKHERFNLLRMPDGTKVCPVCFKEEREPLIVKQKQKEYAEFGAEGAKKLMYRNSVVNNKEIFDKGFKNYETPTQLEDQVKVKMLTIAKKIIAGEKAHVFLQGPPGAGKSHLAMAVLKNVNDSVKNSNCVFVNFNKVLLEVRGSFESKNSDIAGEKEYIELMSKASVLVIDDLGSEIGDINTNKKATDFVHRILYPVLDARVNKSLIITSNIPWGDLERLYDAKLVSRMKENLELVTFGGIKDKRGFKK